MLLPGHLGYLPVLTPAALKVAARRGYREGGRSRMEVKERLPLDGIDMLCDRSSVDPRVENSSAILPDLTNPFFTVGNEAPMRT